MLSRLGRSILKQSTTNLHMQTVHNEAFQCDNHKAHNVLNIFVFHQFQLFQDALFINTECRSIDWVINAGCRSIDGVTNAECRSIDGIEYIEKKMSSTKQWTDRSGRLISTVRTQRPLKRNGQLKAVVKSIKFLALTFSVGPEREKQKPPFPCLPTHDWLPCPLWMWKMSTLWGVKKKYPLNTITYNVCMPSAPTTRWSTQQVREWGDENISRNINACNRQASFGPWTTSLSLQNSEKIIFFLLTSRIKYTSYFRQFSVYLKSRPVIAETENL